MRHTLIQVDDFAPDAAEVRKAVIEAGFSTEKGPDGFDYTGICKYEVPHWFDLISKALGQKITPKLSCFRLNLAGELPHSWIHSDDICAQFASVLYLNPPEQCRGGTAFWRHTGLQLDEMPPWESHPSQTSGEWFLSMMNREWKDLTFWEQSGFVSMRFNRFITYPTSRFHSRYPFEGFGTGPQDGRLIWACFFSVEDSLERTAPANSS
jgi:hypothetical protein